MENIQPVNLTSVTPHRLSPASYRRVARLLAELRTGELAGHTTAIGVDGEVRDIVTLDAATYAELAALPELVIRLYRTLDEFRFNLCRSEAIEPEFCSYSDYQP